MGYKIVTGALLALSLVAAPVFAAPAKVKNVAVSTDTRGAEASLATLDADLKAAITAQLTEKGLLTTSSGSDLKVRVSAVEIGGAEATISAYVRQGTRQKSSKDGVTNHSFRIGIAVPQARGNGSGAANYQALVNGFAAAIVARIAN